MRQVPTMLRPSMRPEGLDHLGMVAVDSGDVVRMTDASSSALLEQLADARSKWRFAPLFLVGGALLAVALALRQPPFPHWIPTT